MATRAQVEGNKRYQEKLDRMVFYVKKGEKQKIEAYAKAQGMSVNKLIVKVLYEHMENTGIDEPVSQSGDAPAQRGEGRDAPLG